MEDFETVFQAVFGKLSHKCLICNSYLQIVSVRHKRCPCGYGISYRIDFFSNKVLEINIGVRDLYFSIYTNLNKIFLAYKYIKDIDSNVFEFNKDPNEIINCVKSIYDNRIFT